MVQLRLAITKFLLCDLPNGTKAYERLTKGLPRLTTGCPMGQRLTKSLPKAYKVSVLSKGLSKDYGSSKGLSKDYG